MGRISGMEAQRRTEHGAGPTGVDAPKVRRHLPGPARHASRDHAADVVEDQQLRLVAHVCRKLIVRDVGDLVVTSCVSDMILNLSENARSSAARRPLVEKVPSSAVDEDVPCEYRSATPAASPRDRFKSRANYA